MSNDIDIQFADCVMGRARQFTVGKRKFTLYPVTLGKLFLLQRSVELLGVKQENIAINPYLESLRVTEKHKNVCCRIIAYLACKGKDEVMDDVMIKDTTEWLVANLDKESCAAMLLMFLTHDKTHEYVKRYGLAKDLERKQVVMKVKQENDKNTFSFGGLTVYGTLIDWAAERYGWTKDYIVWGIDLCSLKMMQMDSVSSVYVSDDERKRIHVPQDGKVINGDDAKAIAEVIQSETWD